MFTKRSGFRISMLLGMLWLAAFRASAAAPPAVSTLARLGGDPNGYHAMGTLVLAPDGNYYGTTEAGGAPNFGTVFQLAPAGVLTTIYTFTGGADGGNPQTGLTVGPDGNMYGTTPRGTGTNGQGTIFQITTAGLLTTLHTFSVEDHLFQNTDGSDPQTLTLGSDGIFYGAAKSGGAHSAGTIFTMTTTGEFTVLYSFLASSATDFFTPTALVEGDDHNFYGGAGGGANMISVIFKVTPMGDASVIYNFTGGAADGGDPTALTKGPDGALYGGTLTGGVFRITTDGDFSVIHSFSTTTEGMPLAAPLTLGSDGNFYGTTSSGGLPTNIGGSLVLGYGSVFQMTPEGMVTVLHTFNYLTNGGFPGTVEGANPAAGVARTSDGTIYGVTTYGNTGSTEQAFIGPGTVFKLAVDGTFTKLFSFTMGSAQCLAALWEAPDGNFYGTSALGGVTNDGTLFGVSPHGKVITLHSFDDNVEGSRPAGALVEAPSGTLYGTLSEGGGLGGGSLFALHLIPTPSTNVEPGEGFHTNFTIEQPDQPFSEPDDGMVRHFDIAGKIALGILGSNLGLNVTHGTTRPGQTARPADAMNQDILYGVSMGNGGSVLGRVFSVTQDGTYAPLHSFAGGSADGSAPSGTLIFGKDGNLYGTTTLGGAHNQGTVYSITPAGTVKILHSFTGKGDGAVPKGALVLGKDGFFYGTTAAAAAFEDAPIGAGTIFKISAAGKLTTLHAFKPFTGSGKDGGADPEAGLIQATDGNFYGVTAKGGAGDSGTVFSMTPGGTVTTLASFGTPGLEGTAPTAPLLQSSFGFLYGTTASGGTDECGTAFVVQLIPTLRTIAGSYSGLGTTSALGAVPDGRMSVTLSTAGRLSGSFLLGKTSFTISGPLGADASFTLGSKKIAGHNVVVSLQGDLFNGTDALTGTISVDGVVYNVSLNRATFVASTNKAPEAGRFTFTLPANPGDAGAIPPPPQGTGIATAVISTAGAVTIAGKLADGTAFSSGGRLAKDGSFPLFTRLYGNLGLLAGTLIFTAPPRSINPSVSDLTGDLTWLKPAQPTNKIFPAAITTTLSPLGSAFTAPPKKTRLLPGTDSSGDATIGLTLPAGGDTPPKAILISTSNTITYSNATATDKLSLTFTTINGLFSGHFLDTDTNKSTLFSGAILEKQQIGAGYFVDPQGSGGVILQPAR